MIDGLAWRGGGGINPGPEQEQQEQI